MTPIWPRVVGATSMYVTHPHPLQAGQKRMLTTSPCLGFLLGLDSAIDSPDPLGVVWGERRELSGTWAQKVELYFAAGYAANALALCKGNKLDNKIWFITQGGSNQEFTLGLEVFSSLLLFLW